jgi:hypothetical protein
MRRFVSLTLVTLGLLALGACEDVDLSEGVDLEATEEGGAREDEPGEDDDREDDDREDDDREDEPEDDEPEREDEPERDERSCDRLFDDCLALGVSEETCRDALDECLDAAAEAACEDRFWACIDEGNDLDVCIEAYEDCSA